MRFTLWDIGEQAIVTGKEFKQLRIDLGEAIGRPIERGHGQFDAAAAHHRRGAPQRRQVAGHEAAAQCVGRVAERLGDDLRPDAGGVAQGDGQRFNHGQIRLQPFFRLRRKLCF